MSVSMSSAGGLASGVMGGGIYFIVVLIVNLDSLSIWQKDVTRECIDVIGRGTNKWSHGWRDLFYCCVNCKPGLPHNLAKGCDT